MAHIRQILANLSISASEFKKNPKSVIKAVKSEPIAVIINDKPAFYCVPADILESLYSKFYEMNEIQNIQDLDQADSVGATTDDDGSFGVRDIFQTVEDEQNSKLLHPTGDDVVDPLSNHIADPLDEEVANQLSYSLRSKTGGKGSKRKGESLGFDSELSSELSHPELDPDPVNFNDLDDLGLAATPDALEQSAPATVTTATGFALPTKPDHSVTVTRSHKAHAKTAAAKTTTNERKSADPASAEALAKAEAKAKDKDPAVAPMPEGTPQERELEEHAALSEAINDVSQQIADNNRGIRRLVSGPHSFTLEHVAKTYSPYAQKKIQAKLKKSKAKKSAK